MVVYSVSFMMLFLVGSLINQQLDFTACTLTCHSRKSPGVNMNYSQLASSRGSGIVCSHSVEGHTGTVK